MMAGRRAHRHGLGLALATISLGCGPYYQDLGGEPPVPAASSTFDPTTEPPAQTPGLETRCPTDRPTDGLACGMVRAEACSYVPRGGGCTSTCVCSGDGRWICLETGCDAFTGAACTEGASCEEGAACELPAQRVCACTSSGRLHCHDAPVR